jgi:UDP-N-acetylmuramoyl-L-alanyl-D-glutamate--2,6-diaminopimelate ligase
MTRGLEGADARRALVVVDRREAIRQAVLDAAPGSCVLVAGKGHEDYQILGTTKVPFDDVKEVRDALAARAALAGTAKAWGPPRGS